MTMYPRLASRPRRSALTALRVFASSTVSPTATSAIRSRSVWRRKTVFLDPTEEVEIAFRLVELVFPEQGDFGAFEGHRASRSPAAPWIPTARTIKSPIGFARNVNELFDSR